MVTIVCLMTPLLGKTKEISAMLENKNRGRGPPLREKNKITDWFEGSRGLHGVERLETKTWWTGCERRKG